MTVWHITVMVPKPQHIEVNRLHWSRFTSDGQTEALTASLDAVPAEDYNPFIIVREYFH